MRMPITSSATSERLKIEGPFDLSTASEVSSALRDALCREGEVIADLSAITTCDASALQALFAAKRTAMLLQKRFGVAKPLPEIMVRTGVMLGLELEEFKEEGGPDAV